MKKNREWEALEGGGVFTGWIILFIVVYSLIFSSIHIIFSQYLGTYSQKKIDFIWDNLGKNKADKPTKVKNIWFRKKNYIGYIKEANLKTGLCNGIEIYETNDNFNTIFFGYSAKYGIIKDNNFDLKEVYIYNFKRFDYKFVKEFSLKGKDFNNILEISSISQVEDIPIWKLKRIIDEFKRTGANIQNFLTVWYSKISYSISIIILSIIAYLLGKITENLPVNVGIGLLISFIFYGIFVFGTTLAKNGSLPPFLGAFLVHIIFVFGILLFVYRRKIQGLHL